MSLPAAQLAVSALPLCTEAQGARRRQELQGWAALAVTLAIWAGFFISLRAGARVALPPAELALIRFGPAGLLFLPLLATRWRRFAALPARLWVGIIAGAGLPYFLIAGWAMRHAPVADGATLIPGTLPLSTALLGLALQGRAAFARWPALLCIAAGVASLIAFGAGAHGQAVGYALFLLCSLLWSNYTLALREARLQPLEAAALISSVSLIALLPWCLLNPPRALLALDASQLLLHGAIQGLGVGLVSTLSYSLAVQRLGAQRCAAVGALTPVLAGVLAWAAFGEQPGLATVMGMGLIVGGVWWSQRAPR